MFIFLFGRCAFADLFAEGVGQGFSDVYVGVEVMQVDFQSAIIFAGCFWLDDMRQFAIAKEYILLKRGFCAVQFQLFAILVVGVF